MGWFIAFVLLFIALFAGVWAALGVALLGFILLALISNEL